VAVGSQNGQMGKGDARKRNSPHGKDAV